MFAGIPHLTEWVVVQLLRFLCGILKEQTALPPPLLFFFFFFLCTAPFPLGPSPSDTHSPAGLGFSEGTDGNAQVEPVNITDFFVCLHLFHIYFLHQQLVCYYKPFLHWNKEMWLNWKLGKTLTKEEMIE